MASRFTQSQWRIAVVLLFIETFGIHLGAGGFGMALLSGIAWLLSPPVLWFPNLFLSIAKYSLIVGMGLFSVGLLFAYLRFSKRYPQWYYPV